jgi:hypothetical protein
MSQLLFAETFEIGFSSFTTAAIQASNGDYILAGRMVNQDDSSEAVAIRVRPDGVPVWERIYSADYSAFFQSITQIASGDFIATGTYFCSEAAGNEHIWVARLDVMGEKIWEGTFGNENEQNGGYTVTATSDGGFIVTGLAWKKEFNNPSTWVLKFDKNNQLQWNKKFDGGLAYTIIQTRDGGYALSGARRLADGENSIIYLLRLDADGNKLWERADPDYEIYLLLESGIIESDNGDLLVVAKSVLMRLDSSGNPIWARQAGNLVLNSVVQMPDGTYAIGGSLDINCIAHAYAAVIDQQGENILWDNTDTYKDSGIAQLLINQDGYLAGGGFGPSNDDASLMFLTIFYPARTVVSLK